MPWDIQGLYLICLDVLKLVWQEKAHPEMTDKLNCLLQCSSYMYAYKIVAGRAKVGKSIVVCALFYLVLEVKWLQLVLSERRQVMCPGKKWRMKDGWETVKCDTHCKNHGKIPVYQNWEIKEKNWQLLSLNCSLMFLMAWTLFSTVLFRLLVQ